VFKSQTLIRQQQMIENLRRENESLKKRIIGLEQSDGRCSKRLLLFCSKANQIRKTGNNFTDHSKEREMLTKAKTAIINRYAMLLELFGRGKTACREHPVRNPAVQDENMTGMDKEIDHLLAQAEAFRQSVETMKRLSEELERTGVNAAAEAIRAGKRGKGFLIVAEEINRLSDHSKRSVEEAMRQLKLFTEITGTLSRDFSKTVESIEKEMGAFTELRKLMDEQLPTYKKENRETRDRM
jgi:hypothetical protein